MSLIPLRSSFLKNWCVALGNRDTHTYTHALTASASSNGFPCRQCMAVSKFAVTTMVNACVWKLSRGLKTLNKHNTGCCFLNGFMVHFMVVGFGKSEHSSKGLQKRHKSHD